MLLKVTTLKSAGKRPERPTAAAGAVTACAGAKRCGVAEAGRL